MSNTTVGKSQQGSKEIISLADKAAQLDQIADQYSSALSTETSPFTSALVLSEGIAALRELLTDDIMGRIMNLAGSPLGFLTDRDKTGGYKPNEVKDAIIEASLRGFRVAGNEFNIIASRFYAAKNGLHRKVVTWSGLTDFKERFTVPKNSTGGAVITASATWLLEGSRKSIDRDFAIRVNAGQGADAILGKAQRKLYAAVLNALSGIITPEGEPEDALNIQSQVVTESAETIPQTSREVGVLSEVTKTGDLYSATFNIPQLKRAIPVWTADEAVGEQMRELEEGDVIVELRPDKKGDGAQVISVKLARPDDAGKGKDDLPK